jgi:hypothetical protein
MALSQTLGPGYLSHQQTSYHSPAPKPLLWFGQAHASFKFLMQHLLHTSFASIGQTIVEIIWG